MSFPVTRQRRLRRHASMRALLTEHRLVPADLVFALTVTDATSGGAWPEAAAGVKAAVSQAEAAWELGVRAVVLYGAPERRDALGTQAYDPKAVIPESIAAIRRQLPEMMVGADICLCAYTDHGHCGMLEKGVVLNDDTLELLGKQALNYAKRGAHFLVPSAMADGQVGYLREVLDEAEQEEVALIGLSAWYDTGWDAGLGQYSGAVPAFGDTQALRLNVSNAQEAVREAMADEEEGADMIGIKPASLSLDILRALREASDLPLVAFESEGFARLLSQAGAVGLDGARLAAEGMQAAKRAGADLIVSPLALEVAAWLKAGGRRSS